MIMSEVSCGGVNVVWSWDGRLGLVFCYVVYINLSFFEIVVFWM